MKRLGLVVLGLALAGCGGSTSSAPSGGSAAPAGASQAPAPDASAAALRPGALKLSGSGNQTTAPFDLVGGDYQIDWTATPTSGTSCTHDATLDTADGSYSEDVGSEIVNNGKPYSISSYVFSVPNGSLHLTVKSDCTWTFAIAPKL